MYRNPAAVVLDVRSPAEVAETGTLKRAVNVPHRDIAAAGPRLPAARDTPLLVFCLSGGRASVAASQLKSMGYTNVLNAGGYSSIKNLDSLAAKAPSPKAMQPADGPAATRYRDPTSFVLDVRGPDEVANGTLRRAVNIPHTELINAGRQLPAAKGTPILVFCRSGGRAGMAQATLKLMGYTDVLNGGGYEDLKALDSVQAVEASCRAPAAKPREPPAALPKDPIAALYHNPDAFVLDVRGPEEAALGTLRRAVNIPHTELANAGRQLPAAKGTPILVFCRSGGRAGMAQATLKLMGYTNVVNAGGYADLKHLDELRLMEDVHPLELEAMEELQHVEESQEVLKRLCPRTNFPVRYWADDLPAATKAYFGDLPDLLDRSLNQLAKATDSSPRLRLIEALLGPSGKGLSPNELLELQQIIGAASHT
eukprot:EG_transcript_11642